MPTEVNQKLLENRRHDIRSSLIGILGLAQAMQKQLEHTDHAIQSEMLTQAIAAHLDFQTHCLDAAIDSVFYISNLVDSVIALVKPQATLKNIQLHFTMDASLKESILSDAGRLFRVLYELLSNAIKFTESGGVYLEVSKQNDFTLRIKIEDTGIGISISAQHAIFERYYRGNHHQAGMGIGLSQVKEDIAALNGSISVKSEINKGSAFCCDIPMQFKNAISVDTEKQAIHFARVLLIEDHPVAAIMAQQALTTLGHVADIASTLESVIYFLKNNTYHYILMDLNVSDTCLTELLDAIRNINKSICIIGLTADKKIIGAHNDLLTVLEKPLSTIALIQALKSVDVI
jgi:CheY-like chemotaxis protein